VLSLDIGLVVATTTCSRYIILKQWCIPHINTNIPAMIPTYGGVLSAVEKALQELMEEY